MFSKESESMEPLRAARAENTSGSTSTAPRSVSPSFPTLTSGENLSASSMVDISGVLDHSSGPVSGGADSVHPTDEPQSTPPLPPPRGTAQELFLAIATGLVLAFSYFFTP